jgi:hypothetical protein
MISKIIHYCWLSDDPIPEIFNNYINTWKLILSDYEFILWNFERFDINSSIWVKEAFENKKYAFAADYIRLYAVYNYGGIYLDMDVQVLKTFNPFLNMKTLIGYEQGNFWPEMAVLGAEKNSLWIKYCLDYYKDKSFINKEGKFNTTTLPIIIRNVLKENKFQFKNLTMIEESFKGYDETLIPIFYSDFFSPKSFDTGKINLTNNTVCIHHFEGSWLTFYDKVEQKICLFMGVKCNFYLRKIFEK